MAKRPEALRVNAEETAGVGGGFLPPDAHFTITDKEFALLRELIYTHTGISLSDHKRALVCSRLARRLRHWGLKNYAEYYELLTERDPEERELMEMINAITTNKTEFFREPHHFQFLTDTVLPAIRASHQRRVRIWSAASSSGEEAYSIAMTVAEAMPLVEYDLKILASDIDTNVLERAQRGVYPVDSIIKIPADLRSQYFQRGTRSNEGQVRVKPFLQTMIRFRRLNLIDESWPMQGPFDVIFCRNVLIYFDKAIQRRLIHHFAAYLRPGGYLMLGHAEAIHGFEDILKTVGHSIYMRREAT